MHMTTMRKRVGARIRHEAGFTLIELLVTMVAGIVVLSALYTILDVTLRQTSNTFTRLDSTGTANSVLAGIENELHSACVASGETPIQGGANGSQASDANDLVFLSQYGTSASPTPVEHKIAYSAATKKLIDYTYTTTGGQAPNWTFGSTVSSSKVLLTNVTQNGSTPIFQYFAYEPYTDANGNTDMMLMDGSAPVPGTSALPNPDPLSDASGLSATDAVSTAEVLINFVAGAAGHDHENTSILGTATPITDSVVFRFTPAADESGSGTTFGPCS
ncbi:MAG TPA: prepilin-type N-terminal cleavage/methylation domain-containing protein [Solirubrobacteraceae bacterium]|nr:prepilin-type N-terminal cleavage/methylation domain-containing protein [Solirubrobacteraceae bacterium]